MNQFDCNMSGRVRICESCIRGKQTKLPFKTSTTVTSEPLELVHSDLCGKMGEKSLGGAEYFLMFLDHHTHYCWVYPLERKDQVFSHFKDWKAEVERQSDQQFEDAQNRQWRGIYLKRVSELPQELWYQA